MYVSMLYETKSDIVAWSDLPALTPSDFDKFLLSIGREPAYVDLEVIYFCL
jgi:hypothetical protein